jgi:hypothetical protein
VHRWHAWQSLLITRLHVAVKALTTRCAAEKPQVLLLRVAVVALKTSGARTAVLRSAPRRGGEAMLLCARAIAEERGAPRLRRLWCCCVLAFAVLRCCVSPRPYQPHAGMPSGNDDRLAARGAASESSDKSSHKTRRVRECPGEVALAMLHQIKRPTAKLPCLGSNWQARLSPRHVDTSISQP